MNTASKYGYSCGKGFETKINFVKGSKEFMSLHENKYKKIETKIIFRKVFETHRDKVAQVALDFPDAFGEGDSRPCQYCEGRTQDDSCNMRITYDFNGKRYKNCAYGSFMFNDITLNNVGKVLELYLIENKIVDNTHY